jgi:hypothetical protein
VFVSGIDPGWALDILPALVSGVSAGITEIRVQELFNYALYDQPDVVREVIAKRILEAAQKGEHDAAALSAAALAAFNSDNLMR